MLEWCILWEFYGIYQNSRSRHLGHILFLLTFKFQVLIEACICSSVLPLVSGTTTEMNKIAMALIAA